MTNEFLNIIEIEQTSNMEIKSLKIDGIFLKGVLDYKIEHDFDGRPKITFVLATSLSNIILK
jgi:hypothetical protein